MANHPKIVVKRAPSDALLKACMAEARKTEWSQPRTDGLIVIRYTNGRGGKCRVHFDYGGPDGGRPAEVEAIAARTADAIAEYMVPPDLDADEEPDYGEE